MESLLKGTAITDAQGCFSFEVPLAHDLPLGSHRLDIYWPIDDSKTVPTDKQPHNDAGKRYGPPTEISLDVQAFDSTAANGLTITSLKGATSMVGQDVDIVSKATNAMGRPLRNAAVQWSIQPTVAQYKPPGWDGFRFHDTNYLGLSSYNSDFYESPREFFVTSDSSGKSAIRIAFKGSQADRPTKYHCQAAIGGKDKPQQSNWLDILVHPADTYVGIKMRPVATSSGGQINVEVVATDLQGKIKPGTKVKLEITERVGSDVCRVAHKIVTVGQAPARIIYMPTKHSTTVTCLAEVRDAGGRLNKCSIDFSPEGDLCTCIDNSNRSDRDTEKVILSADKTEYQPGDTAVVEIRSPFPKSRGMLFLVRDHVVGDIPLILDSPIGKVSIPITEDFYPSVSLRAYLAHGPENGAEGDLKLSIPPIKKRLSISTTVQAPLAASGKEATIDVLVKDSDGKVVPNCQVMLGVFDEDQWTATFNKWPDPIPCFYPNIWYGFFAPRVFSSHSRLPMVSLSFTGINMAVAGPKLGELPSSWRWPEVLGAVPKNRMTNDFSGVCRL